MKELLFSAGNSVFSPVGLISAHKAAEIICTNSEIAKQMMNYFNFGKEFNPFSRQMQQLNKSDFYVSDTSIESDISLKNFESKFNSMGVNVGTIDQPGIFITNTNNFKAQWAEQFKNESKLYKFNGNYTYFMKTWGTKNKVIDKNGWVVFEKDYNVPGLKICFIMPPQGSNQQFIYKSLFKSMDIPIDDAIVFIPSFEFEVDFDILSIMQNHIHRIKESIFQGHFIVKDKHTAKIKVDELGTTASSETRIELSRGINFEPPVKKIIFNHTFYYNISFEGVPLFTGKVEKL